MCLAAAACLGAQGGPEAGKQVHVVSSGLKAGSTWHRKRILNDCRECCGGMGFMAANKIGPMLNGGRRGGGGCVACGWVQAARQGRAAWGS